MAAGPKLCFRPNPYGDPCNDTVLSVRKGSALHKDKSLVLQNNNMPAILNDTLHHSCFRTVSIGINLGYYVWSSPGPRWIFSEFSELPETSFWGRLVEFV